MAFNENKREDEELTYEEASDVMRRISSMFGVDVTDEDIQEAFEDYTQAVTEGNEPEPEAEEDYEDDIINLADMSLIEKLGAVCHETFNSVLTGELRIESGQELQAMAKAVAIREDLRAQYGE